MKEKDIIPEVIKLSKEIAELWRMEIYEGCWIIDESLDGTQEFPSLITFPQDIGNLVPIPSISDCLEKLNNSPPQIGIHYLDKEYQVDICFDCWGSVEYPRSTSTASNTLHQALLSALLKVLRG